MALLRTFCIAFPLPLPFQAGRSDFILANILHATISRDVLRDKGSTIINTHLGNLQFQNLVNLQKRNLGALTKNKEKQADALDVFSEIVNLHPPGQFLEDSSMNAKRSRT